MDSASPIVTGLLAQDIGMLPILAIVAILVVLIVILIKVALDAQKRAEERRRQEFHWLAQQLGFESFPYGFAAQPPTGFWARLFWSGRSPAAEAFLEQFRGFEPFFEGHSYLPVPILRGVKDGVHWMVFDYEYKVTTSTGKSTSTVTYNVSVVVARPPYALPSLRLSPEGFWSQLGGMLGMQDLQFESEDFNRRYRVQGQDKKAVYDLLHPQTLEYLMGLSDRTWQMAGPWLVIWERTRLQPTEYLSLVEDIAGFLQRTPEYYRQDKAADFGWFDPLDAAANVSGPN